MDPNAETVSGGGWSGPTPERIGAYRILAEIGQGGFGVVYEAEQTEPVRRRVAIKVVKPGMDSDSVVARFGGERQALAVMDHACIAKVLDGGVTAPEHGSRPYFVMELVRGEPITEFCDTHMLSIDQRVELFIRVCGAVQHAHAKGVIHRDLKPSNVLVGYDGDGVAQPKVIDFGVAKALNQRLTEKTVFTERGQLIGTPEYMSPEQAEMSGLDIDTRADVYSLGVLLYELLTGMLPFDPKSLRAAAFGEIQRIIREVDPPKPSTRLSTVLSSADDPEAGSRIVRARHTDARSLSGVLKRDLDWVVMKCLEKDRERRYDTANALGAELRRYLGDEPVEAGPPSMGYRVSKFVRRNRAAVLAVSAGLTLLVVGGLGTTFGFIRANQEAERARAAAEAEAAQRVISDQRAESLELVTAFQAQQLGEINPSQMASRLRESLEAAIGNESFDATESLWRDINFTDLVVENLEDGLFRVTLDAIDQDFADRPLIRARLLRATGFSLWEIGLVDLAYSTHSNALEIRLAELGEDDPDTLESLDDMAKVLLRIGRGPEAIEMGRDVVERCRRVLGNQHHGTLTAIENLAVALSSEAQQLEAVPLHEEALRGFGVLYGEDHPITLTVMTNLGAVLMEVGDTSRGSDISRDALSGRLRVLGPNHLETHHSQDVVASILSEEGRHEEAVSLSREALDGYRRLLGDSHETTIEMWIRHGAILGSGGQIAGEELCYQQAAEASARSYGVNNQYMRAISINRCRSLYESGEREEAIRLTRVRLDEEVRRYGEEHTFVLTSMGHLGAFLRADGQHEEAEPFVRAGLAGLRDTAGTYSESWMMLSHHLSVILASQRRWAEAEQQLLETLAIFRARRNSGDVMTLDTLLNLAHVVNEQGRPEEAIVFAREGITVARSMPAAESPTFTAGLGLLRDLLMQQGRHDEAATVWLEIHGIRAASLGPDHRQTVDAQNHAGLNFMRAGRFAEAEVNLIESLDDGVRTLGPQHDWVRIYHERAIEFYDRWHANDPEAGHDISAEVWRSQLAALPGGSAQPSP